MLHSTRFISFLLSFFLIFPLVFVGSRAGAQESVSPPFLWERTTSISLMRLVFCGQTPDHEPADGPVVIDSEHRVAIYRNMAQQYFTTLNESDYYYDIPLKVRLVGDEARGERLRFYRELKQENGKSKYVLFADILFSPGQHPVRIRVDESTQTVVHEKCEAYRFSAELIRRGGR